MIESSRCAITSFVHRGNADRSARWIVCPATSEACMRVHALAATASAPKTGPTPAADLVGLVVDGRRRLVEQEQLRMVQKRPVQSQSVRWPTAGKPCAATVPRCAGYSTSTSPGR